CGGGGGGRCPTSQPRPAVPRRPPRPRPAGAPPVAEAPWSDGQFIRAASAAAARAREAIDALGNRAVREMAIRHQSDTESLIALLARLDGGMPQRTPAPSGLPGGGG
ncbi:hypothetical protein ACFVZX_29040, partial [Streptomyces erythrochromogenes]